MLDQSLFQPIQVGAFAFLSLHLLTDCRADTQCTIDSCLGKAVVFHQVFDEKPVCALLTQLLHLIFGECFFTTKLNAVSFCQRDAIVGANGMRTTCAD